MSDNPNDKKPLPFPPPASADVDSTGTPALTEQARAQQHAQQQHAQMLDLAVRHLYGTALTLCRLTGGNLADVPRILVAAGAHSVQSLIEKLALQQKRIATLETGDARRDPMVLAASTMAGDLDATMADFEGALLEALGNMKSLRELEDDTAGDATIDPDGGTPVH